MLEVIFEHTKRAWQYWLSRRSHKGHINWQKYEETLRQQLPLPKPRIIHSISQRQGQQSYAPNAESPVWLAIDRSLWLPRNRMRETFTSGSVGTVPGNRCLYPESDRQEPERRRSGGSWRRLTPGVTLQPLNIGEGHAEASYPAWARGPH